MIDLVAEVFDDGAPGAPAARPPHVPVAAQADRWARARRVLLALAPEELARVEEALLVEDAGGCEALAAFLEQPSPVATLDTLETATRWLRRIEGWAAEAPPARRASLVGAANATLGRIEQILGRRPPEPKSDEVQDAIRGEMDSCVEHLLRHTKERAAKLARDRAELDAWAAATLGPGTAAELARRLVDMLGAP